MKKQKRRGSFRRLMDYICRNSAGALAVVALCVIIGSAASVIVTLYMQRLIDECILPGLAGGFSGVQGLLVRILATLAAVYVLGVAASFVYTRIMAAVTQDTLRRLRGDMFDRMQTLPISYFDTNSRGDVMSRYTNDTDAIRQLIGQCIPTLMQSLLSIVSIAAMMLYYSLWLSLIAAVCLGTMLLFTRKLGGASAEYMTRQQRSLAAEEGYIEEIMQGQKVVKVFCHEKQCRADFDRLNERLFEDSRQANVSGNILMPILANIGNLMYVVTAVAGSLMAHFGAVNLSLGGGFSAVTVGVVVSFLGMSRQLSQTIGQISMQLPMVTMGLAGAGRVFALLDEQPESDGGSVSLAEADGGAAHEWVWRQADGSRTAVRGDIRLEDVCFGYTPDKPVLRGISVHAQPGQKIAFVGATGAGKTTITNLLNRFYDIQSGRILYDGIDIRDIKKPDLRRSLGVVLQDVNLFGGTVMDNIRYGRLDATDEECVAAAKLANADDFICMLPQGYQTVLSGNGADLSQGQRQLLSIARAAVADPPVMILDEATSSIDTRTETLVQAGMDNLMRGRTVFVIAHRLSTVRNADAIAVLDHGRIVECGSHAQLLERRGVYYQLYTGVFELE